MSSPGIPNFINIGIPGQAGVHGSSGDSPQNPTNAGQKGGHGTDGTPGTPGLPGSTIQFRLLRNAQGEVRILGENLDFYFPHGSNTPRIHINCSGGDGGNGGNGGHGAAGAAGKDGRNASEIRIAEKGKDGGDGGNGGNGADGGNGGDGGNLSIKIPKDDLHLLLLLDEVNIKGGKGGKGGDKGLGGKPSKGGRGGLGATWTETLQKKDYFCHEDSTTTVQHRHGPARDGKKGEEGKDGFGGADGKDGAAGLITYRVEKGAKDSIFHSRYYLNVIEWEFPEVMIPGQEAKARIRLINSGEMRLPPKTPVEVFFKNNDWVESDANLSLGKALAPGEEVTLEVPFRIKTPSKINLTGDLETTCLLDPRARLERLKWEFPEMQPQTRHINVKSPLEMKVIAPARGSIWSHEQMSQTLHYKITNVSERVLGGKGSLALQFAMQEDGTHWDLEGPKDHKDLPPPIEDLRHPLHFEIPELQPGESYEWMGAIRVNNPSLPFGSSTALKTTLCWLPTEGGNFTPLSGHSTQLTRAYEYYEPKNPDLLIISNNDIGIQVLETWDNLGQALGLNVAHYNLDQYGGLQLFHPISEGKQIIFQAFQGRTVVFINSLENGEGRFENVSPDEILRWTQGENGTHLHIVGAQTKLNRILLPPFPEQDRESVVPSLLSEVGYWKARIKHLLVHEDPRDRKTVIYGRRTDQGCMGLSTYHNVHESTPAGDVRIQAWSLKPGDVKKERVYSLYSSFYYLLSILPFADKLRVMRTVRNEKTTFKLIHDVILTDLARELKAVGNPDQIQILGSKYGPHLLKKLQLFSEFTFKGDKEKGLAENIAILLRFALHLKKKRFSERLHCIHPPGSMYHAAKDLLEPFLPENYKGSPSWNALEKSECERSYKRYLDRLMETPFGIRAIPSDQNSEIPKALAVQHLQGFTDEAP